ncbi:hypothetical protein AMK12_21820 [Streptomyces sp. TSRI0395]|nr:hypothetical protein AMK12_21820 [Streptomyces sp. TSRI0395]
MSLRTAKAQVFFGGIYGTVQTSALVAAIAPDFQARSFQYFYGAAWVLVAAAVSALAHGYAHLVAGRGQYRQYSRLSTLRCFVEEWPMIAATLPTLVVLLWAGFWEWPFAEVEYAILAMNTVLLFGWGTAAGRAGGRDWPASLRTGVLDSLMGVTVIVANVLIK